MANAPLTTDLVWSEIEKRSFAVLAYVNPKGAARTAGILYVVKNRRVHINTATDSWKVKHIRQNPDVALNVTIPKRIPFMPWIQIPQATIAFGGKATVTPATNADPDVARVLLRRYADDPNTIAEMSIIEVVPSGHFMTYGVGVRLMEMANHEKARGRVPV